MKYPHITLILFLLEKDYFHFSGFDTLLSKRRNNALLSFFFANVVFESLLYFIEDILFLFIRLIQVY